MCTIVLLQGVNQDYPLIILANRDELYPRPSSVPVILHDYFEVSRQKVIAPKDHVSGGTWIGLTSRGFFAAITNQDDQEFNDKAKSRGQVVSEVLRLNDSYKAATYLNSLNSDHYNSFNLVFGHAFNVKLAKVHVGRPVSIGPVEFKPTVITNDCSKEHQYQSKINRALKLTEGFRRTDRINDILKNAQNVLSDHDRVDLDPHQSICVHSDDKRYGTRSTSVLLIGTGTLPRFFHSEGPTCKSQGFAEYSFLLE